MSKTLILLAALVIVAVVSGALGITSFLRERKGTRAELAGPESAPTSGPQYPPQLDR
jgi:hypothetical protein